MSRTGRWIALAAALAVCGVAALVGCDDNDLGREKRRPNQPPQTILSSGPRDSTYGANYRAHFYWSGSDPDGTIDHYDFILIDHPAGNDSIAAGDPNYPGTVVVEIPRPDDPRWTATGANDTILVASADTLRVPSTPPPPEPDETPSERDQIIRDHNAFVRRQQFQRWHTFFVRAVDNEGSIDATPEYASFNANTMAPTVFLRPPVDPVASQFTGPRVIIFNWDGSDPVGEGTTIEPIASRWTIVQTSLDRATQTYNGYPDTLYTLGPSAWSPWRRWDARDRSGRQAIVRNLQSEGRYLFAVQAMDEAGAVTPIFDAHTAGQNNVAKIFVNGDVGATLIVDERFLGAYQFVGGTRPVRLDVAAGQPLTFRWRADASAYGGEVVAYRYGWDIRNPSNDQEWEQSWCATCFTAPVRVFNSQTHRFFLECRDNAETITHAEFELVVHQVTRRRDLLFVDDTEQPQGDQIETLEDRRWRTALDSTFARAEGRGQAITFDYGRDFYDVVERQRTPPPLSMVFDYKTVVWTVVQGVRGSAINTLANFFDPFLSSNRNAVVPFNYLTVYVDNGGEFWLSGEIPADVIFTAMDRGTAETERLPANITNWDDPLEPHPDQDSVGTRSLLWRLGVEMVDLGAGGRAPAERQDVRAHGCTGLSRATPQGHESQTFTSSVSANHSHRVTLETADVNAPPPAGKQLTTTADQSHTHVVSLTQAQFRSLALGNVVTVATDSSDTPSHHGHSFELVDRVGLWGAPATLDPDDSVWPLPPRDINPSGGRVNVEIYNMPNAMAREQPPLQPDPRIWVAMYNYKSASPANLDVEPPYVYEQTADGQPVILLRRASVVEPYYSRAISGFEVWRLRQGSMIALTDNILLRQFRLGIPE